MKKIFLGISLAMMSFLSLQGTAEPLSLMERLHEDRSSYARYWGDGEWRLKSRLWLPADSDKSTVGLFRLNLLDEAKEVESLFNSALNPADTSGADLMGESASASEKDSGLELKDSGTVGIKRSAYGLGGCTIVSNGVFGGALQLSGGKSAIKLPNYSLNGEFALEAWFKPETLGGTLITFSIAPQKECALTLSPEGKVSLLLNGKTQGVSERRMKPGVFTHVAFVYRKQMDNTRSNWNPRDCLVFMDGYPQIWASWHLARQISLLGAPLYIANSAVGNSPFVGLVDEVRVSSASRDYSIYDDPNIDPLAQRPVAKDAPVMRGREELVLDASLDHSNAVEGVFTAAPLVKAPGKLVYTSARRGAGLIIDASRGISFRPTEPLSAAQGTLEFWYMPNDWDNNKGYTIDPAKVNQNTTTPIFQLLVKSEGQTNAAKSYLTLAIDQTSETKGFMVPYYRCPVQPGTWHHVVITWQGYDVKTYIDGAEQLEPLPNHPVYNVAPDRLLNPNKLQIAALNFGGFRSQNAFGSTLIDEVKLYKHRLTDMEINNAYQRFLVNGKIQPLPPIDFKVTMNHPLKKFSAAVDLLMPERFEAVSYDLEVVKTSANNATVVKKEGVVLTEGNSFLEAADPQISYGDYLFKFAFKDKAGKVLRTVEMPHSYPKPAWVDNMLGLHDGEVMPPWTPMEYKDGVMTCWGREMTIGPAGWPVKILSQGKVIMPAGPEIRLVTDQGEIKLVPEGALPNLVKQQAGAIETEGIAKGGGWTMTTFVRTEFDGFMKLQTRFEGPVGAEVRELRISYPLQFADEQLFGFYTGEHWFRAAHDFRILPKTVGLGRAGSPLPAGVDREEKDGGQGTGRPTEIDEIVFASNKTGRQHPKEWSGKVSFLPYVTVGDDWRSFCWLAENDRNWTQSWTNPAVTISRANGLTKLNLNIITGAKQVKEPLTYTFGLQATPIRPLDPDTRKVQNSFSFASVCGFNGHYMPARFEGHFSFRLSPKDLDWDYSMGAARAFRGGDTPRADRPLYMYLDRTWQRAPEDAREYNNDWRGWGDATRYTKPVRDCYAWYVNEWIRRGIMEGMYIDDVWIDPTKSMWHLDPKDNLAYRKESGQSGDYSNVEWGYEFFDYRDLLKRLRWLFIDNKVRPLIVVHATQTPYYPIFGFVDVMLEGEDRYLHSEKEARDFISTWGIPRLRYANAQKWGVPVQWLPILSMEKLQTSGLPMARWYYQQNRSYLANLLLHDVSAPAGDMSLYRREAKAVGCFSDDAKFIGYWEPANPFSSQEANVYASVYQLPTHLAVVLVNAGTNERVVNVSIDPAKIKPLLGAEQFTITDVDSASIPPIDPELAELKSGIKLKAMDDATRDGLEVGDEADQAVSKLADGMIQQLDAAEKKGNDPDGFFEYHNFRHEKGVLRLRIQKDDYRLLKISR